MGSCVLISMVGNQCVYVWRFWDISLGYQWSAEQSGCRCKSPISAVRNSRAHSSASIFKAKAIRRKRMMKNLKSESNVRPNTKIRSLSTHPHASGNWCEVHTSTEPLATWQLGNYTSMSSLIPNRRFDPQLVQVNLSVLTTCFYFAIIQYKCIQISNGPPW